MEHGMLEVEQASTNCDTWFVSSRFEDSGLWWISSPIFHYVNFLVLVSLISYRLSIKDPVLWRSFSYYSKSVIYASFLVRRYQSLLYSFFCHSLLLLNMGGYTSIDTIALYTPHLTSSNEWRTYFWQSSRTALIYSLSGASKGLLDGTRSTVLPSSAAFVRGGPGYLQPRIVFWNFLLRVSHPVVVVVVVRHHSHPRVEVEGLVEVLLSFYLLGLPWLGHLLMDS